MKPACGPPSSLSPENVTRSAPVCDRLGDGRLMREAEAREIDEGAGAEIVDQRHVVLARDARASSRGETSLVKPSMR